jgi:hypothetical protein
MLDCLSGKGVQKLRNQKTDADCVPTATGTNREQVTRPSLLISIVAGYLPRRATQHFLLGKVASYKFPIR